MYLQNLTLMVYEDKDLMAHKNTARALSLSGRYIHPSTHSPTHPSRNTLFLAFKATQVHSIKTQFISSANFLQTLS